MKQTLIDSKVKTGILALTNGQMPNDENFDFVLTAMDSCMTIEEVRHYLYRHFYDDILEWSEFSGI
jgi:hypothetical protein